MEQFRFWGYNIPNNFKHMLMFMKVLTIFMLIGVMTAYAGTSYSQETKLNLKLENKSVREICKQIESTSDFIFVLADNLGTDADRKVNIDMTYKTVDKVLDEVLSNTDLSYKIIDRQVVIYKNNAETSIEAKQDVEADNKISGTILDNFKLPVIGASVRLEGSTTVGTITDIDGNFTLVAPKNSTLVISYVGYKTIKVDVGNKTTLQISLQEDLAMLDEIVVVGYGTQRKKDLTGSVSSIKSEDFTQGAVGSNPLQLVEGKIAGLTLTRTNGNDPNADLAMQLRGVSSARGDQKPLVIIDGVPNGDLNTLSPNDIEAIDVLKDGSAAAIYGTRGTNGVILVTTKKGKAGKTQVRFESLFFTETIDKRLKSLNAQEYWQLSLDKNKQIIDRGHNTNWFDELVQTPFSHMYNLSISGGEESLTYRGSVSYKDQEGVVAVSTGRKTINGRLALSQSSFEGRLKFDMNMAYSNIKANFTDYAAFEQAVVRNPTLPVYNPDGTFHYTESPSEFDFHPVAYLNNLTRGAEFNKFMGDLRMTVNPISGLNVYILGALTKDNELNHYYDASTSEMNQNEGVKGVAERATNISTIRTLETIGDYNFKVDKHNFFVMGGYSYQDFEDEGFRAKNMNFSSDTYLWNNLGEGSYLKESLAEMGSDKSTHKLIAFLGRVNYNYNEKYLFSASLRREGSSRFGKNYKWGNFPAVSVGWRASDEDFLKELDWLSDFKVRAGYGVTGNVMDEDYISLARMKEQQYIYHEGEWILSYGPSTNPNADLKWEVKHELNLGADLSFLNDRIAFTFDWYKRNNKDLLYKVQAAVPAHTHSEIWANVGEMQSSGVELSVSGTPILQKDLRLTLSANIAYNSSKMKSMSNNKYVSAATHMSLGYLGAPGIDVRTIRLEEGQKVGNFYGYKYQGLTEDGKWIFEDLDDNGVYDDRDEQIIGNGVPQYFLGFAGNLTYKNFDLNVALRGAFKFDILNAKEMYYGNQHTFPNNNLLKSALGKHKNLNDKAQFSSYYLENGNYLKVSNVTVGYNFDSSLFKNYISNLRVFASVDNLCTITGYSGIDPEISSQGLETGIDGREFYPRTRTFSLGVNVSF